MYHVKNTSTRAVLCRSDDQIRNALSKNIQMVNLTGIAYD